MMLLGNGKKVDTMVLKFECPECGNGEKSELLEVLPDRKYRMQCGDCGRTYILTASVDREKNSIINQASATAIMNEAGAASVKGAAQDYRINDYIPVFCSIELSTFRVHLLLRKK